jgi:hypothetical protein
MIGIAMLIPNNELNPATTTGADNITFFFNKVIQVKID